MRHQLRGCLMHGFDRCSRQFELTARLERDCAATRDIEQADHVALLDNRLPAQEMLHAFQERADAATAVIGHRSQVLGPEHEFLVLGADTELQLRLCPGLEPRDQFVTRFNRRQVDLITSHAAVPAKGPRPYTSPAREGKWALPILRLVKLPPDESPRIGYPAVALNAGTALDNHAG